MKSLLTVLLLLPIAGAAQADIRWPNTAGSEYCSMRRNGVSHDSALERAIANNWDSDYTSPTMVMNDGTRTSQDTYEMADYINTMCPSLFGK